MFVQPEVKKMEWGQVKVILRKRYEEGASIEAGVFRCEPGKSLQLHTHQGADEYCWIFEGAAIFVINGKEYKVKSGELIKIPKDLEHRSFPQGAAPFASFFIVCP